MKSVRPVIVLVLLPGLVSALLAGCAIGPNYDRPEDLPAQDAFHGDAEPVEQSFVDEVPWWAIFDDPVLVELVGEALENNRDLAVAVARVEQARQFVTVARSEMIPQAGYDGEAGKGGKSYDRRATESGLAAPFRG